MHLSGKLDRRRWWLVRDCEQFADVMRDAVGRGEGCAFRV